MLDWYSQNTEAIDRCNALFLGYAIDRHVQSFLLFTFLLCHSNHKNITRIAHLYRKNTALKSTFECGLDCDVNSNTNARTQVHGKLSVARSDHADECKERSVVLGFFGRTSECRQERTRFGESSCSTCSTLTQKTSASQGYN